MQPRCEQRFMGRLWPRRLRCPERRRPFLPFGPSLWSSPSSIFMWIRPYFAFCLTRLVSVRLCAGTERGDRDDAPGAQGGGELHAVAANQEGCTPRFCCLLISPIFRVSLLTLCCV
jgi:hypothetical protein